jgi:UDP:flavonoid glycosyltransferase YjiC (YdhE family)
VTIVFYISGHGLGHASRDIEVINSVTRRCPGARVIARTSAPRWFLEHFAHGAIELQEVEVDTGVMQIDSLRLDEDETALRAARFYAGFEARAEAEAAVLAELEASVVVGDVPPLAFVAAARARVSSVALANFTWDWIYGGYPRFERLAPGVIGVIRGAYALTTRALRLPLHGGFEPMTDVTEDIPLIARRAKHRRETVRRALDVDDDAVVVLASFGGYGLRLPYREIASASRFTLVVTDHETGPEAIDTGGPLRRYAIKELAARDLHYPDLVAAADVVVSKPGYGIVSECIVNGAALLYTARGRFLEHDMLVAEMPQVLRCRYIPQEDLLMGVWDDAIDELLRQPPPPERLNANGAEVAADAIIAIAERSCNASGSSAARRAP